MNQFFVVVGLYTSHQAWWYDSASHAITTQCFE